MTPRRLERISEVVSKRQKFLTVVLENIHDPHNVSAILRSADATGIGEVYLIYNTNKFPKIGRVSSASAKKWVELKKFSSVSTCFDDLKSRKFRIYSTHLSDSIRSKSLYELKLTQRTALVFGNEHDGVSEEAVKQSDANFFIPMYGMIQSLNVSVAAAVCMYEALRQREAKGMYMKSDYKRKELNDLLEDYLRR